jgi:hypothetical protein
MRIICTPDCFGVGQVGEISIAGGIDKTVCGYCKDTFIVSTLDISDDSILCIGSNDSRMQEIIDVVLEQQVI